jgi:hypothetical protein
MDLSYNTILQSLNQLSPHLGSNLYGNSFTIMMRYRRFARLPSTKARGHPAYGRVCLHAIGAQRFVQAEYLLTTLACSVHLGYNRRIRDPHLRRCMVRTSNRMQFQIQMDNSTPTSGFILERVGKRVSTVVLQGQETHSPSGTMDHRRMCIGNLVVRSNFRNVIPEVRRYDSHLLRKITSINKKCLPAIPGIVINSINNSNIGISMQSRFQWSAHPLASIFYQTKYHLK